MSFLDKLTATIERNESRLCIGLDPTFDALPEGVERTPAGVLRFNRAVVEATADLACAEALGTDGWRVLEETVRAVPDGIPVIADAKRGDIGSTASAYATAIYDRLGCDACTVSPYLGFDAVAPFIARAGAFSFVPCRTSNPSAPEVQDLQAGDSTVYERVAALVRGWNRPEACGLVVGATDPAAAARVVALAPDLWLLAPGLGAQGGDLGATAAALGASA